MLHPFVSLRQHSRAQLPTAMLSAVVHAGLITGLVSMSGPGTERARLSQATRAGEHINYVATYVPRPPRSAATGAPRRAGARATAHALDRLAVPIATLNELTTLVPVAASTMQFELDFGRLASRSSDFADAVPGGAFVRTVLGRSGEDPLIGNAYLERSVERTAVARRGNPIPDYPERMRRDGVEADFVVRFVVDSSGRVDAQAIDFPQSVHRLFTEAVRRALLRSRYLPAELGGRRVRQHVQQQFIFRLVK